MSGVGSTEPPKSEGPALPAREREMSGVGSTEPPKSEGPALPARERA
jgi:hypothetical protein